MRTHEKPIMKRVAMAVAVRVALLAVIGAAAVLFFTTFQSASATQKVDGSAFWFGKFLRNDFDREIRKNSRDLMKDGKEIFRHDTFGDEEFWGGTLRLHEAIAGADHVGVGPGVSPETALAVGLKVDVDALPKQLVRQLKRRKVDLGDPATTLALLQLDPVVGVKGFPCWTLINHYDAFLISG